MSKFIKFLLVSFVLPTIFITQNASALFGDTGSSNGGACVSLQSNLAYGSRDTQANGDVTKLQTFLYNNGYLTVNPTGFFGVNTRNAVKAFQSAALTGVQANNIDSSIITSASDRLELATTGFILSNTGYVGMYTRAKIAYSTCSGTVDNNLSDNSVTGDFLSGPSYCTVPTYDSTSITNSASAANGTCELTLTWPGAQEPLSSKVIKWQLAGSNFWSGNITLADDSLSSKSKTFILGQSNMTVVISSNGQDISNKVIGGVCASGAGREATSGRCMPLATSSLNSSQTSSTNTTSGSSVTGSTNINPSTFTQAQLAACASSRNSTMESARSKGTPYIINASYIKVQQSCFEDYYDVNIGDMVTLYGERLSGTILKIGVNEIKPLTVTDSSITFIIPSVSRPGVSVDSVNVTNSIGGASGPSIRINSESVGTQTATANMTVNGLKSTAVYVGDPYQFAWSSSGGKSYNAKYVLTGCSDKTLKDGGGIAWDLNPISQSNGNNGNVGASRDFAGCTITGTYTVTGANNIPVSSSAVVKICAAGYVISGDTCVYSSSVPIASLGMNGTGAWSVALTSGQNNVATWSSSANGTAWSSTYSISGNCANNGVTGVWKANTANGSASLDDIVKDSNAGCSATIVYTVSNGSMSTHSSLYIIAIATSGQVSPLLSSNTTSSSQVYDSTFTTFTTESLAARAKLKQDLHNMFFYYSLTPKVGDKANWGNGTVTHLMNSQLLYDEGNNSLPIEIWDGSDIARVAITHPLLNQYFGKTYGINVSPTDGERMGASANAYTNISMYGLGSNFTEQSPYNIPNSAVGNIGAYKDISGNLMFKTPQGNLTQRQFEQTNYYKAIMDGGTTYGLTGTQQTNRAWPPISN